ncbi:MAG TPA: amino acid permease [Noviherbaspirillum sp.]|uniref:APC family permease n=1 Tax=Noviherbaspirillum sp. TaxID=1926288 RepID=UPI002D314EAC|nr:amino acid permease [Noviherbaspirillum sp.]HYD95840.1 amino acid permease [Noviherbaspirillum sp.]
MHTKPHDNAAPLPGSPQQVLRVRDATAVIVGIVVGAGIFKAPATVAGLAGDPTWIFALWLLGGVISLVGALCYAELATAFAHAGGDYHFLQRAYGPSVSFLFWWARFSVVTTGSIALLAFVFGDYMNRLLPLPFGGSAWYAALAVAGISWINLRGTRTGIAAQAWLTAIEAGGLLLVAAAGLLAPEAGAGTAAAAAVPSPGPQALGLAMVFVLLTYGGWNEAAYISAELKDVRRGMVRSLVWSILIITALYLLVNWAYWHGLGVTALARTEAPAADLLRVAFGPAGEKVISAIVAVAALTSLNATMIVGARTSYAMGRDWPALASLGLWDSRRGAPVNALRVQGIAALLLVAAGSMTGSGFNAMVEFTAPVFWLFFLLSGISLFLLRLREPAAVRPFRVPLYPLLPAIFCATCAYMLWSSLSYVSSQSLGGINAAWMGVAVLAAGCVLLWLMRMRSARIGAMQTEHLSKGDVNET